VPRRSSKNSGITLAALLSKRHLLLIYARQHGHKGCDDLWNA
jgi:hypothetical protein